MSVVAALVKIGMKTVTIIKTGLQEIVLPLPLHGSPGNVHIRSFIRQSVGCKVQIGTSGLTFLIIR